MSQQIKDFPDVEYETKTVVFHDAEGGLRTTVMATKFEALEDSHLGRAGFRGDCVMFLVGDGGTWVGGYAPRRMELPFGNDNLKKFLVGVRKGVESGEPFGIGWGQLQEGHMYTPGFVDGLW